MANGIRRISVGRRSKMLHIEGPGCIINITPGLEDRAGRPVVHIEVIADEAGINGEQWRIDTGADHGCVKALGFRVVMTNEGKTGT
jgi:hypothetical protein